MTISIKKIAVSDLAFIFFFTYSIWEALIDNILPSSVANIFCTVLMVVLFAFSILVTFQNRKITDVLILFVIVVFLFAFTYLCNLDVRSSYWNENWGLSRAIQFSTGGIWAYLAVRLIPNSKRMLSDFTVVAYITFVYYFYSLIRMFFIGMWYLPDSEGVYRYYQSNMGFGYSMMFVAIVFLCLWVTRRRALDMVMTIICSVSAFLWGSRGSLFCLAMAVILLFLHTMNTANRNRRILILATIILIALLLIIFSRQILAGISAILEGIGLSSRTVSSLLLGTYTDDASRTNIWNMVLEGIQSIFPFGYGTFGDRSIVMPYYNWGYSHDIFLEMTISFGIFGLGFLIWIIYRTVKIFRANDDYIFILIILASMAMKLLISDSFWFDWSFWGLLALCVSWRKKQDANIVLTGLKDGSAEKYSDKQLCR